MSTVERIEIERLAYGGDAVGHLADGRVAFVPGAVPGDIVEIEVVEDRGRFVRARIARLLEASADRVDAPCPFADACGGCPWQHVAYEAQLHAKRDAVVDALGRIGHLDDAEALVDACVPSPMQFGYRNKVELRAETAEGRLRLGFARAGTSEIVEIDSCLLLPKKHQRDIRAIAGALRYVQGAGDLGIERVGLRVATHTADVEIAVWTPPGPFPRAVAAKTLGSAVKTAGVVRVLSKDGARRKVSGVEVLSGRGFWRERVDGRTLAVSAPSFFQVNTRAAELLVRAAVEALGPSEDDRVLDLYAGVGTFTLPFAAIGADTLAVEAEGSAVRDLRRNIEHAGLWAEVVGGDAARELPQAGGLDLALVDPPRCGLERDIARDLAATGSRRIAYVSCDPPTLARDLKTLADAGYRLVRATPFDLFPQTWHVETLAVLEPIS